MQLAVTLGTKRYQIHSGVVHGMPIDMMHFDTLFCRTTQGTHIAVPGNDKRPHLPIGTRTVRLLAQWRHPVPPVRIALS